MQRFMRNVLVLGLLLGSAPGLAAQIDSLPVQTGGLLHFESGIVLRDNGAGLYGFSAATGEWTLVAPTGSTVLERGDWMALVQRPNGTLVFFVGRTGEVVSPPDASTPFSSTAQRGATAQVGFVSYTLPSGVWRLFCVSGRGAATWDFTEGVVPHATATAVVASERVGLEQFHVGFAARTGSFETTQLEPGFLRTYSGTGDVACVETATQLHVFSGVYGLWNTQPLPQSYSVSANMVLKRDWVDQPENVIRYSAFSAYDLGWVDDTIEFDLDLSTPVEHLGANWCCIRPFASSWRAIGARPHLNWVGMAIVDGNLTGDDDGFVVLSPGFQARSFSGLAGGSFQQRNVTDPAATIETRPHFFHLCDGTTSHFYSPMRGVWSQPILDAGLAAGDLALGDAGSLVRVSGGASIRALTCRGPAIVDLPGTPGPGVELLAADTLFAVEDPADSDSIRIYDPRDGSWQPPLYAGANPIVKSAGNVFCVSGSAGTFAYSVQSGRWTEFTDPSGNPIQVGFSQMFLQENLALVLDNGYLTAFGSSDDVHVWHDYPASNDYLVTAPPGPQIFTNFHATLRRPAGTLVANYYGPARLRDGQSIPLPVAGLLWLLPAFFVDSFVTTTAFQRWQVVLPAAAPSTQTFWTQSIFSNPLGPEPFVFSNAAQSIVLF